MQHLLLGLFLTGSFSDLKLVLDTDPSPVNQSRFKYLQKNSTAAKLLEPVFYFLS